jgi:ferredoxin-NADP reductase
MIRVEKPKGFAFRPVQFCGLEIMTSEGSEEYPMSLACSPTKPYLEFGARVVSGSPWKRAFTALRPGDEVEVDGAYGHFVLDETRDAVLIAGGIGITPLKGMAEWAADTKWPRRLALVYSNKEQKEIAYREELDAIAAADPRSRVLHTLTQEPAASGWTGRRGRIDAALLAEAARGLDDPTYYVCGKPGMVQAAVDALAANGVGRARLVYESFTGYA